MRTCQGRATPNFSFLILNFSAVFNVNPFGVQGVQVKGGHVSGGALHVGDVQDGLSGADAPDDPRPLVSDAHGALAALPPQLPQGPEAGSPGRSTPNPF